MNIYSINCHSSIKVVSNGINIYFDPYGIKDDCHDADLIFITHTHYNHFSPEDINRLVKQSTVFICPDSAKKTAQKAGYKNHTIITAKAGERKNALGVEFECVPAYNENKTFHPKSNGWVGYVVNIGGEIIYVAGDTDALSENADIKCDIAFVPVGGTYTMNYSEASEFIKRMKPKIAVPTHYGSVVGKKTDGESFKALVNGETEVKILIK